MLVLTRKTNEEVLIDGCIKVTVVKVQGQKVRIGIDAPDEVSVHRAEIAERIRHEEALPDDSRLVNC